MTPVRTCVGCGRQASKAQLLRLVRDGERLVADTAGIRPGRGAYLCRSEACFEQAARRHGFARALRHRIEPGASLGALLGEG